MNSFLAEIRQTIVPGTAGDHGPLPPMLVAMTVVTGLVDAFSYLVLSHVFVANMTGNVVLLGFALAGAPGFSVPASAAALAGFALGALGGGRLGAAIGKRRGALLSATAAGQAAFLAAGVILAALTATPAPAGYRYSLIFALAIAMGAQNATARRLAVPDLTTTVLTLTITGIAADSGVAGGQGSKAGRRLVPAAAMLAGAVVGAVLVIHAQIVYPLAIALAITVGIALTARALAASRPAWDTPKTR